MKHAPTLLLAALAASCPLVAPLAHAQPSEAPDKGDAKALLASGLKLFAAKDYLGALSVFETAYERYPSPKILLNIGTTLLKLDRKADAANTYQRYLDAKDVDEKKQAEAKKILAGLDKELGVVDITATPENAEIQIGSGTWVGLDTVRKVRVTKGEITILARAPRYKLHAETITINAGETKAVAFTLEAEPEVVVPTGGGVSTGPTGSGTGVVGHVDVVQRSKLGVLAAWHVDPLHGTDAFPVGSTVLVGATFDVTPHIAVQAAALLGNYYGPYAGGQYAFLLGRLRPIVALGVPVVFANGARVSLRGAAGVELMVNRHVSVVAEVGVERLLNKESDIMNATLFVPSLGMTGRL